jgi:nucleoside-diphosphate-sugar epimerase
MQKILILGSEGQIGSHLKKFLIQKKYKVIEFDIILGKEFDLRTFQNQKLENEIKKSDFVFFLAFDVGGSRYLKKYQKSFNFLINNSLIMTNVFFLLNKHKKKFIFASSQMSNMDFSPYGTLKRIGEEITKSLNCIYVKFWNVYGIENNLEKSHVITDFIKMAFEKKKINMLTNGKESREFLYAEDCSNGLLIIMKKFNFFKNKKKELHLTTGKKIKIIDIAKIIKKIFSKKNIKISIISSNKRDELQKNINNNPDMYFSKFWKKKYNIQSGIFDMIEYYENKFSK